MKKATPADVFYIQQNPENLEVGELAKATGLSNTQVKTILAKVESTKVEKVEPKVTQFDRLVGKHKDRKGVVVMTQGASELIDASRQANKPKDTSSYISKARP